MREREKGEEVREEVKQKMGLRGKGSEVACCSILTLYKVTPHHTTPPHHIASHHITSHHITSHFTTAHHTTTSHHITSQHSTAQHSTLYHITSHHITLHHITSYHITSHHIRSDYAPAPVGITNREFKPFKDRSIAHLKIVKKEVKKVEERLVGGL